MTTEELVERVAQMSGLDHADAEKAVLAVLEQIADTLGRDDTVTFTGFGTLRPARSGERHGPDVLIGSDSGDTTLAFEVKGTVPKDEVELWSFLSRASADLLDEADELGRSHEEFEGQIKRSRRKLREIAEQA